VNKQSFSVNKDLPFWVATSAIPGVGIATFNYLLKCFKPIGGLHPFSIVGIG